MHKTRRPGGWCGLVMMALVLVMLPVVPATADHSPPPGPVAGGGSLEGTELVQNESFTGAACFRVSRSVFGLRGIGTYSGRTADGQEVLYRAATNQGETLHANGPLQVEVENTQTYYHGPFGTHGTTDAACGAATAGDFVPAEFRIFAAEQAQDSDGDGAVDLLTGAAWVYRLDDTGAKVPCTGQGSFARGDMNQDPNWRADWTLAEDCIVVGNETGTPGSGVSVAGTALTHHGLHGGCFNPPCYDNFEVDYKQYPPVEGLAVNMTGPNSAQIGDAATVTSRVTEDGAPVANVAVNFSVAGAGPGTPPGGAALTDANGQTSFTFTAAIAGDYTVTASATSATDPADTSSATHTVQFAALDAPDMTLTGPTWAQTGENNTVAATVTNAGNPVPGVTVDFAVTGAGQATPASGSAVTDADGRASFTFSGDRAGDYTVTAAASHAGQELSATHAVELEINTFYREGAISLETGSLKPAVMDPAGDYAYFGKGRDVVKVDLNSFQPVATITLNSGESTASAVIDPAGRYAYFGTGSSPGRVVKVDLATFERVGAITLDTGENALGSAVIDAAGRYAYFGTAEFVSVGRVVKVDLVTFERVAAITLEGGETQLSSAVIDPAGDFAYFGARGEGSTSGHVVKVNLATFERVGAVILGGTSENSLLSAVIDPAGRYAYFGTDSSPGRVVKIDLAAFERVGALTFNTDESYIYTAVIDPVGRYAYFGTGGSHRVVKVDLATFERIYAIPLAADEVNLRAAVIDPDGINAYFGTSSHSGTTAPGDEVSAKVVKVALTRPSNPDLAAADDAYDTDYLTPLSVPARGVLINDTDTRVGNGDALTAHNPSDPAGGSVSLNPDGSFTYTPDEAFSGTDTFTYTASDGVDYSAPATVSIAVAEAPESVRGSAYGFFSKVSLFGGPAEERGPDPTVALPPDGSATPITASAPSGSAVYGPATIFSSGPLDVTTTGTMAGGSVSSSTDVDNVNTSGDEVFTADNAASTCEATETGVSGTTTITNGTLRTSEGDPNVEGDEVVVDIPANPEPNTVYAGQIETVGDHFEYIFNEQVTNPDGSITVYAAHQRLLGPTAIGDLYIGKAECGMMTAAGGNTAPTAADDAYTTARDDALQVPAPGVLANDTDPDGDELTATSPADPVNGTVTLNPDGSFTYSPDAGFVGTDSFTYTADDANGGTATATVSITVEAAATKARVADFDGDGDSDRSVFRNGAWYAEGQPAAFFGVSGDVPVPGDYSGDGTTDRAVNRKGAWHIAGQPTVFLGNANDIPVPGDYDGDGDTEAAVYRKGAWHIAGQPTVFLGNATDIPVPGDYDGDGDTEAAVYRNGAWHVHNQAPVFHGVNGDIPVPGDYNGDGTTERAVYRKGAWYVEGQPTVFLGNATDIPVPGDYDANGTTERAVYRNGAWHVEGQPAVFLGVRGDIPLPLPHAVYRAFF